MADSTDTITTIEQGDAALEAQNSAMSDSGSTSHDFFQDSSDDSDDTEDPVARGQRAVNSLPMYRAVVPKRPRRGQSKTGSAMGPSGHIPNLTPGARNIP